MIVDHQVVELQSCVSVPAEVHHAWDLSARSARQTLGISGALIEAMSKAMQSSNHSRQVRGAGSGSQASAWSRTQHECAGALPFWEK